MSGTIAIDGLERLKLKVGKFPDTVRPADGAGPESG